MEKTARAAGRELDMMKERWIAPFVQYPLRHTVQMATQNLVGVIKDRDFETARIQT